jgi:DNA-binding PadR family transcriptional regulator
MKDLTLYESIILLSYLDQIHRKGYVSKSIGKPSPERGGRRKILYTLTPDGAKALKAAYKLQKVIWADMPK